MIDKLLPILVRQEGLRLDVYRDSEGFWTIGIGYLVSRDQTLTEAQARAMAQGPWTKEQAESTLRKVVEHTVRALNWSYLWFKTLPELVQMGLTNMQYQLGAKGVKGFPKMLAALEAGDYPLAERCALASAWHTQTPSRCEEVAAMIGNRDG